MAIVCTICKDKDKCSMWRRYNGLIAYVADHTDGAEDYAHVLYSHCDFTIPEIEDELYECGIDSGEIAEIIDSIRK